MAPCEAVVGVQRGTPIPGTDIRPRPGTPLILLYVACAAAPPVVAAVSVMQIRAHRADGPSHRTVPS